MENYLFLLFELQAKDTYHIILVAIFPINVPMKKSNRSELIVASSRLSVGLELRFTSGFKCLLCPPGLQLQLTEDSDCFTRTAELFGTLLPLKES